jgi:UDP-GlcNAc:undecaprenyl-phosphate GlcNAc-1-phosphate transferase
MTDWLPYLVLFATALVVTLTTVPAAKRIAVRLDAIDYPDARRINTEPIPRMGGIAIFAGIVAAVAVQQIGSTWFSWPELLVPHHTIDLNYPLLGLAAVVVFVTGLIDDVRSLKPAQKFAGQLVAACIAAAAGLLIGNITNPFGVDDLVLGWVAYPITVIYLVSFTNVINLIDGLDGLAAGITAIAASTLFIITLAMGRSDAAMLAVILVGACLGFLRYNFHPASVFMGDSGSNLLGFLLGVVGLLGVTRTAAVTTLVVPLIVAGVPIIDTFAAIVRRRRNHVGITHADKGHIQHRLIKQGFDQRQVALLIYAWSIFLSAGAVVMTKVGWGPRIAILLVLVGVSIVFVAKLRLFEPVLRHYYNPRTHADEIIPTDGDAAEPEEASRRA